MSKLLFALIGFLASFAQQPPPADFTILGEVPSLPDSTILVLSKSEGRAFRSVDTAYVVGGRFSFIYPVTEKGTFSITVRSDDTLPVFLEIWAAPGETAMIRGENNLMYTWSIQSSIPEQQESEYYKQESKALWDEFQLSIIQYYKLQSDRSDAASEEEKNKIKEEIARQEMEWNRIYYLIFEKKLSLMAGREPSDIFLRNLSEIGAMASNNEERYGGLRDRVIEQYERLTDEQKTSELGKALAVDLFPADQVKIGDEMADAELPDLSGRLHKLSDYKGKYILLDFWSAGCGPCIMAMPELKEISEQHADRLTIIGITSDSGSIWSDASKQYDVSWVNLSAPGSRSEITAKYGVSGIPHQVLISPEGIVVDSWVGYGKGNLKKKLKKYLPEPPADSLVYTRNTPEQQTPEYYKQEIERLQNEFQQLGIERNQLLSDYSEAVSGDQKKRIRQEMMWMDVRRDSVRCLYSEKKLFLLADSEPSDQFMRELSKIALMIFHYEDRYGSLRDRVLAQFERLTDEQKASDDGKELSICLFPPARVKTGDEMADAELPDLSGRLHKLSDYKGKYILLDFWNAACGPCIMAMPELKEISEQYADLLTVISITSDKGSAWRDASEKHAISWVNLSAPGTPSEIAAKYGVSGIPHQVLISPEGIVVDSWAGYGKGSIRMELRKHLPEPTNE